MKIRNPFKRVPNDEVTLDTCDDAADTPERGRWGSQLEFTLSCVGYCVGFGNIWRFPYVCMRNGGGAFLIPYFTFLFLCALPVVYLEFSLGQFSSLSPVALWNLCPLFKGLGWGMLVVSSLASMYLNVIISWFLLYFGVSFTKQLPWTDCGNAWNTVNCSQTEYTNASAGNASQLHVSKATGDTQPQIVHNVSQKWVTPAEEFWIIPIQLPIKGRYMAQFIFVLTVYMYYRHRVIGLSDGLNNLGGLQWELAICLTVAWILVFLCIIKGVRSSGKVVYVTATVPYLFLTILIIRGSLLSGSLKGVKFYLTPDWSRLLEFRVWCDACLQIFHSLGPAWGGLLTMASYNKFNNNCRNDAIIACVSCAATSFYAGFAIFCIIGYLAEQTNKEVKDVITAGPGLFFIAYPQAVSMLPIAPVWSILFFLMAITVGLDSMFVTMETVVSGLVDQWPELLLKRKTLFTLVACFIEYLLGLTLITKGGMYLFILIDWYCATFSVIFIAISECLIIVYVYGLDRFCYDIGMMVGSQPSWYWRMMWSFITPLILIMIFIFSCVEMIEPTYRGYVYPRWGIALGWAMAIVSLVPLPVVAVYKLLHTPGTFKQRFIELIKPTSDWGPAITANRRQYSFCRAKIENTSPAIGERTQNSDSLKPLRDESYPI